MLMQLSLSWYSTWPQHNIESLVKLILCLDRYAGIANLKMRDLESSMRQLWKQHAGADFNVFSALSIAQPMKSLQG